MLTHMDVAPWTIIKSDDKMRARINAMRHVLHVIDYEGKDESVAYAPDPVDSRLRPRGSTQPAPLSASSLRVDIGAPFAIYILGVFGRIGFG